MNTDGRGAAAKDQRSTGQDRKKIYKSSTTREAKGSEGGGRVNALHSDAH